jgi:hypothetical protein
MKSKLFGAIIAPVSILGLTFALGLGTTAFGVGEQQQTSEDTVISALDVTTDIPVVPWCGWYVSTSLAESIALAPAADEPTSYTGEEISLTATGDENFAYVGPNGSLVSKSADTACSWFNDDDNKYGARYDVSADGSLFSAEALSSGGFTGGPDAGMDFSADTLNPLRITNVGIDTCTSEGFATNASAEITDINSETTPWTVLTGSVTNNNFCAWSAKYEINIPADMSPLYGNVTYRWTGPRLTHTLVIPEDQVGDDPL